MNERKDPDPMFLPEACLWVAIEACKDSQYRSDRLFAADCKKELKRRREGHPCGIPLKEAA